MSSIRITDTITIQEDEFDLAFVRASGPGGQNVNKTATAVQLRFNIAQSSLPREVKRRLRVIAGRRVTEAGVLVLDARRHRTQMANRQDAVTRLVELIRRATIQRKPRRPTRPSAASKEQRLEEKRRRGKTKAARRSPREGDD